jgi:hypothetical protein
MTPRRAKPAGSVRNVDISDLLVAIGEVDHSHGSQLSPAVRARLAETLLAYLNSRGRLPPSAIRSEIEGLSGVRVSPVYADELVRHVASLVRRAT